jgi:4-hydroxybenzoate polyprenyltransferase
VTVIASFAVSSTSRRFFVPSSAWFFVAGRIRLFLEMIRFSHTVFALPFALLSATLAWHRNLTEGRDFRWRELAGIVLCMVFARSLAMAFNRLVDRRFDSANPRTAGRHIPAGLLSVSAVLAFCVVCAVLFVASTLLFLPNPWPVWLAVPVLVFLCSYSYAKRFTSLCHYWLGAALMLAPLAAWIALRGELAWPPAVLAAVVFFWVGGFDILYACQDADFDKGAGLSSIPARFGIPTALRIAMLSHLVMLGCLGALWYVSGLGPVFLAGVLLVAGLLAYEHALVRPHDLTRVNIAFFNINAVISLGLLAVVWVDLACSRWWP